MKDQLVDVMNIQASGYAFAVLRRDGRVVTWGAPDYGGHSWWDSGLLSVINGFMKYDISIL